MTTSFVHPAVGTESGRQHNTCPPEMGAPLATERLLFRYDPTRQPSITYWSIPHQCTGTADTLDGARQNYRATIAGLLEASSLELPPVIEHLEVLLGDMWVRTMMTAAHRDAVGDRMFVQTLLSGGRAQSAMRAALAHASRSGNRPVVVVADPDDTVGSVLDQMRADDTVLVVHPDVHNVLRWIILCGPNAVAAVDSPRLPDVAELAAMPIDALTRAVATEDSCVVRLYRCPS